MKKSMFGSAVLIVSMTMFPMNAQAAFWLDIVKEFVSGGIKTIVMPKSVKATNALTESKSENKKASSTGSVQAPKTNAQPSPEEIFEALQKLEVVCMQDFLEKIPCAIGTGKNFSIGAARQEAIANARVEMANSMGTYVEAQAGLKNTKEEDPDELLKVASSFISEATLTTKQLVTGAQQYLSYTYIDEGATEKNGRTVYITTVVMVMDKDLFRQALEDAGKDTLGDKLVKESRKGVVAIIKNVIKKI